MNRLVRPVSFTFEPDVVQVYARASFGAAGAPTLVTASSKGVCNWSASSQVWTGTTTNTSASVTGMTSLYGVYNGMSVTGTGIPASTTVSAVNPTAGTLTLSNAATASGTVALTFSGGQYIITMGSQYTPFKRLDSYVRLLQLTYNWDDIPNSNASSGSSPAAPAAWFVFLLSNQLALSGQPFVITGSTTNTSASVTSLTAYGNNGAPVGAIVPGMAVSGTGIPASTTVLSVSGTSLVLSAAATATNANVLLTFTPVNPASVIIQCGTYSGSTFSAANPASGEILRLGLDLSRSNAI